MHDRAGPRQTDGLLAASALILGFVALIVGVLLAHGTPATGYESSLYSATPAGVWLAVGLALLISLLVALFTRADYYRRYALLLGGASGAAVVSLPLIRSYYFFGYGDALTHLGWAKDIMAGELGPFQLFYPALHTLSVLFTQVLDIGVQRAMLLVVLLIVTLFLVFVPLCVDELTESGGLAIGLFAALLVLPVNHIALHYMGPHPVSEAILFSPVVLYLLVRYVNGSVGPSYYGLSAVGGVFALALAVTVLYHSMQAANLLAFLVAIVVFQFVARRYYGDNSAITGERTLYVHTAFLGVVFVLWNSQFAVVGGTIEATMRSISGLLSGEAAAGEVVASRSESLAGLGTGLGEVFFKLFVPSAVFAALTAGIVALSIVRWREDSLSGVRALGAGLLGVGLFTLPFVAGTVSKLVFRNMGFVMVMATILGAVAIVKILEVDNSGAAVSVPTRTVLAGGFSLLLVLSMVVLFPSPYIYQPNGGVAEGELQGYEDAFEMRDESVNFAGIRSGPQRFVQAVYGRNNIPEGLASFGYYRQNGAISGENLTRLSSAVTSQRYLVVTAYDRVRELEAYDEFRYTESQLAAVDRQPGVDRVMSNGEFTMHLISPASES